MFGYVAKHKRLLQFVLVLFIVPPFAFWGLESYSRFGADTEVAVVSGQKISEKEFADQLRQQQERMRSLLGRNYDASVMDTPAVRAQLLDGMISQRLLTLQAVRDDFAVSDEQLREVIGSIPAFQDDGKFSRIRYEDSLRREGYTPQQFETSLRRDLMIQQLTDAISDSGLASKTTAKQIAELRAQQREVAEYAIGAEQFAQQVKITPEAVQAYYEANPGRFEVPEQLRAEYVVLTGDALLALEPVSPDEIRTWYQANVDRYQEKEQRRASHILVLVKPGASAAERKSAREKVEGLLAKVRAAPASFADIAKNNSDDPGSAANGGDLGYFSRGMMAGPVEDAVFRLKLNEISGVVESDFGFHIIRTTGITPGKGRSLEEVRGEIEQELKRQRAGRKFAEAAEAFSNMVYEQPDSLKPVAEKYKLPIQTSGWATRRSAQEPVLNNPRVLSVLFSDEGLKNRRNTEAVEVGPGTLVSARVLEHRPATVRPLDEVRADIQRELRQKEAAALAAKQGAAKLEELRKGNAAAVAFGSVKTVSRDDPKGLKPDYLEVIFRADRTKLPAYDGVELPNGYVLLRVGRVIDVPVDESRQKSLQTELGRAAGAQEFEAYLASLRARGKIAINKALLEKRSQ